MKFIEDMISESDQDAIRKVLSASTVKFDELVEISGLLPKQDFKGCDLRSTDMSGSDLRGFDFSDSDLRYCVIDDRTIIDETTVLNGASVCWIHRDLVSAIDLMKAVEVSGSSKVRLSALDKLVSTKGKSKHVVDFLIGSVERAKNMDEVLDYIMYLPSDISLSSKEKIKKIVRLHFDKKIAATKRRTGREKTQIFAIDKMIEKISHSPNSLAGSLLRTLIDNTKSRTEKLSGVFSADAEDLRKAFEQF